MKKRRHPNYTTSRCRLSCPRLPLRIFIIFLFAPGFLLLLSTCTFAVQDYQGYEDITPARQPDWTGTSGPAEEITPLKKSRDMQAFETEPEESAIEPVADTEPGSATAAAAGLQGVPGMATSAATASHALASGDVATAGATSSATSTATATPVVDVSKMAAATQTIGPIVKREPPPEFLQRGPIYGDVRLEYRTASASGNEPGFLSQHGMLFSREKLKQETRLFVDKEYENGIRIRGRFMDMPFQEQHLNFDIESRRMKAGLGDINGVFRAGSMVGFTKKVRGLDMVYNYGRYSISTLFSRKKSNTGHETFRGRNIRGPYVLQASSVLENSEMVHINGAPVSPAEYSMDYFLGQITFYRNLDPTDIVEITYESILDVALRTGSLKGLAVHADLNADMNGSLAYIEEESVSIGENITYESSVSYSGYDVKDNETDYLEHNYVKYYSEIVALTEGSDTEYLERGVHYEIEYYNPTGGNAYVSFTDELDMAATASVTITYSYYDQTFLQRVEEEELRGFGETEFILSKEQIYPGPEIVYLFVNDVRHRQLLEGEDYEISMANNSIIFLRDDSTPDESLGQYVTISYEIVPPNDPGSSVAKRRVLDATGRWTPGKLDLRGEYSRTNSDIAFKQVQVLEERVATVSTSTVRIYPLDHQAIPGTEEVYFNDTISSASRKKPGIDYVIEEDSLSPGDMVIRFNRDIQEGTTIIASYKYAPVLAGAGAVEGEAGRILADYETGNTSFYAEHMIKSLYFTPMTSYNDLERDRTVFGFDSTPSDMWSFGGGIRKQQHAAGFTDKINYDTDRWDAYVRYAFGRGAHLKYIFQDYVRSDDRPVSETDIERSKHRVEGRYVFEGRKVVSDFHYESRNLEDRTDATSDQQVEKVGIDATYVPDRKFSLKVSANSNKTAFNAPEGIDSEAGDFETNTFSSVVDMRYMPFETWTFSTGLDTQTISDSREDIAPRSIQSIKAAAFSRPFGKINRINLFFNRHYRPNPASGQSRAEVMGASIAVRSSKNWVLTPRFSKTKASVEGISAARHRNVGLRAAYRQDQKSGIIGSIEYSGVNRGGTRAGSYGSTWIPYNSSHRKTDFTARYLPGTRYEFRTAATFTRNSGEQGDAGRSVTSSILYRYSDATRLDLTWQQDRPLGNPGVRHRLRLGSNTVLDQNFSLSMNYITEEKEGSASSAYDGTLFNMVLDMKF